MIRACAKRRHEVKDGRIRRSTDIRCRANAQIPASPRSVCSVARHRRRGPKIRQRGLRDGSPILHLSTNREDALPWAGEKSATQLFCGQGAKA